MQSNGERNGDELDGIQRQMNATTNESLESTRRMLGLVTETQEVGVNTMIMLDDQGEKLNRIEVKEFHLMIHFLTTKKNCDFRMVRIIFTRE